MAHTAAMLTCCSQTHAYPTTEGGRNHIATVVLLSRISGTLSPPFTARSCTNFLSYHRPPSTLPRMLPIPKDSSTRPVVSGS